MNSAILTPMRTLDDVEKLAVQAEDVLAQFSDLTPVALRQVFTEWPLVSAPKSEAMWHDRDGYVPRSDKLTRPTIKGLSRILADHE